jgi:hypothetical protein
MAPSRSRARDAAPRSQARAALLPDEAVIPDAIDADAPRAHHLGANDRGANDRVPRPRGPEREASARGRDAAPRMHAPRVDAKREEGGREGMVSRDRPPSRDERPAEHRRERWRQDDLGPAIVGFGDDIPAFMMVRRMAPVPETDA